MSLISFSRSSNSRVCVCVCVCVRVHVCAFVSVCLWLLCCSVSAVERARGKFWHFSSHKRGCETWKPLPPSWGYAEFVCLIKGGFTQMTKTHFLTYLWWNLGTQGVISAQVSRHGGFCCHITLFVFQALISDIPDTAILLLLMIQRTQCQQFSFNLFYLVESFNVLHTCSSHGYML